MVVYFNKKDLVKFGQYLLSEERTKRITENTHPNLAPVNDRLKVVHHSDVENFLAKIKKVE